MSFAAAHTVLVAGVFVGFFASSLWSLCCGAGSALVFEAVYVGVQGGALTVTAALFASHERVRVRVAFLTSVVVPALLGTWHVSAFVLALAALEPSVLLGGFLPDAAIQEIGTSDRAGQVVFLKLLAYAAPPLFWTLVVVVVWPILAHERRATKRAWAPWAFPRILLFTLAVVAFIGLAVGFSVVHRTAHPAHGVHTHAASSYVLSSFAGIAVHLLAYFLLRDAYRTPKSVPKKKGQGQGKQKQKKKKRDVKHVHGK